MADDTISAGLENLKAIRDGSANQKNIGESAALTRGESNESIELTKIAWSDMPADHDEPVRSRDDIDSLFVDIVNILEPENKYYDENPYPITKSDVEFSYCTKNGSYRARCGPRRPMSGNVALFAVDKHLARRMKHAHLVQLLVHEATHITEGGHTPGSAHNPRFWKQMAENVGKVILSDEISVDNDLLFSYARHNPNKPMTDRRSMTVVQQKKAVEADIRRYVERHS